MRDSSSMKNYLSTFVFFKSELIDFSGNGALQYKSNTMVDLVKIKIWVDLLNLEKI